MNRNPVPASLTAEEAGRYSCMVLSWLQELHDNAKLNEQVLNEFTDINGRLSDSIKLENCDPFGKLEVRELQPATLEIFTRLCVWADIVFHNKMVAYKKSLH